MVLASRRERIEGSESVPDIDVPPTGMTSGSSEEDRIRAQRAAAVSPSVPKRTYCAHVQPCKVCNPTPQAASSVTIEPSSTVEPTPRAASSVGPTQRARRSAAQTVGADPTPVHGHAPVDIDPVQALLVVLDVCKSDAERTALLDSAPEDVRRQLATRLRYDTFIAETAHEVEALDADLATFTQALDDAPDDAARLALIRATDSQLVAEWRWNSTATEKDYRIRYMRAAGVGA